MENPFNPDGLILSAHYRETMEHEVLPYLKNLENDLTISGFEGKPIFVSQYMAEDPQGTILLLHGFTECAFKFSELIYSLLHNHFSVVAYDHRGHGHSWRDEEIQDTSLTHVDDFGEYVADMEAVCKEVLFSMPKPYTLFSHSMGGAVSALYLEKHPQVFSRAVLSSPMIAPNLSGLPVGMVKCLCSGEKLMHNSKKRVFISKPYHGKESFDASCATGKERFDWYDDVKAAEPLFHNNGPTYGWTSQSVRVIDRILAPGAVEKIACPLLLYTAEYDSSVMPKPQEKFIQRVRNGKRVLVHGVRHEIYRSHDEVLFPWWHETLRFLAGK